MVVRIAISKKTKQGVAGFCGKVNHRAEGGTGGGRTVWVVRDCSKRVPLGVWRKKRMVWWGVDKRKEEEEENAEVAPETRNCEEQKGAKKVACVAVFAQQN